MIRDLTLRFAGEAEWLAAGIARDPGLVEIDVIGAVAGEPGWFVNLRVLDERELGEVDAFVVTRAQPVRVWA